MKSENIVNLRRCESCLALVPTRLGKKACSVTGKILNESGHKCPKIVKDCFYCDKYLDCENAGSKVCNKYKVLEVIT